MSSLGFFFAKLDFLKILLLSTAFGWGYYSYVYNDGSSLKTNLATLENQIQASQVKKTETEKILAQEVAMKAELGSLSEAFREVTSRFPLNLRAEELIGSLNNLSRNTLTRVVSISKQNTISRDLYDEIPLNVEFSGSFSNLLMLIFNIVTLEKVTNIGDFSFSQISVGKDSLLKLTTTVIGYRYKQPQEQVSPPDPTKKSNFKEETQ